MGAMGPTGTKFQSEPNRDRPLLALTNEDLPEMDAELAEESTRKMHTRQMPMKLVIVGETDKEDGSGTVPVR